MIRDKTDGTVIPQDLGGWAKTSRKTTLGQAHKSGAAG
jgi:hypothetical protein